MWLSTLTGRRKQTRRRLALVVTSCLLPLSQCGAQAATLSAVEQGRPYSVTDLLSMRKIGRACFTSDGGLIFEVTRPYDQTVRYDRAYLVNALHSDIYYAQSGEGRAQRLPIGRTGDGVWIASLAPSGERLAYFRATSTALHLGVYDLREGRNRELSVTPNIDWNNEPVWRTDHELLISIKPFGIQSHRFQSHAEPFEKLAENWLRQRDGEVPTAWQSGSGRLRGNRTEDVDSMVSVNVDTGDIRVLAKGNFIESALSADGAYLALVRGDPPNLRVGRPFIANALDQFTKRLLVVDLNTGSVSSICKTCEVLFRSLSWSQAGPILAFYARLDADASQGWSESRYYLLDTRKARAEPLRWTKLDNPALKWLPARPESIWLGETFLAGLPVRTGDDWRLNWETDPSQRGLVRLRNTLKQAGSTVVAAGFNGIMALRGGNLWRIEYGGASRELRNSELGKLSVARQTGGWLFERPLTKANSVAVLHSDGQRDLVLVDPLSSETTALKSDCKSYTVLAASAQLRRAAVACVDDNVTYIKTVTKQDARQIVPRINEHLRGVLSAQALPITFIGPKQEKLFAWLFLPKAGQAPYPLVVDIYPGRVESPSSTEWTLPELDPQSPTNPQLLAAQGVAVLIPTIPMPSDSSPRSPSKHISEYVSRAIDAAIETGRIDPTRLAIEGHSFGAYATMTVIEKSHRYRAAVARAGPYDWISSYGTLDSNVRWGAEGTFPNLFGVGILESGQTGLGNPPWNDPTRYVANSPLFKVKAIRTPVLLIHGDKDEISITQSDEMFTALHRIGADAEFVRYEGEAHLLSSPANIRDSWRRVMDWYRRYLN